MYCSPTGSRCVIGTILLVMRAPVTVSYTQPAVCALGLGAPFVVALALHFAEEAKGPVTPGMLSEKLPGFRLSNKVGTVLVEGFCPWTSRKNSASPKKKVRSFQMGPPRLPPNWFCRNSVFGRCAPNWNAFAFSASLRKNSYSEP